MSPSIAGPSIALVLGRPPTPASVLPEMCARLEARGVEVTVTVVPAGTGLPDAVWAADLRVLKDLSPAALASLAAHPGAPCCNDPAAVLRAEDKARAMAVLADAGIPVPATWSSGDWADVRRRAGRRPAVVKPRSGAQGRGVLLLDREPPPAPPVPGPWLVQERIPGDGRDRKLYVAGDHVDAVLRDWPAPADRAGSPFAPDPVLRRLASAAATALNLEICGVDVVVSPAGPVVVDVNPFPGFKGVRGAADRLAGHLLSRVWHLGEVTTCA